MSKLRFVCPKCGEHNVEEVVSCNQASFLLTDFDSDGSVEFAEAELDENAYTEYWRCADCGYILKDVSDIEDIIENYSEKLRE